MQNAPSGTIADASAAAADAVCSGLFAEAVGASRRWRKVRVFA